MKKTNNLKKKMENPHVSGRRIAWHMLPTGLVSEHPQPSTKTFSNGFSRTEDDDGVPSALDPIPNGDCLMPGLGGILLQSSGFAI